MPTTYAIIQGNKYMDATLYTGTGANLAVVNSGIFKPDFVWAKSRSTAYSHILQDSVRGAGKSLVSNSTGAEGGNAGDLVGSFNSNGFNVNTTYLGGSDGSTDFSAVTYVGWQWAANQGANVTNTTGTITSTVSANATAGFSVVTFTGNGTSGATFGHGLGAVPAMFMIKGRNATGDWQVYHQSIGNTALVFLNLNIVQYATPLAFNNTSPTSSVITLGSGGDINGNTKTYVAYCWTPIAGFSQFGSYTGNGSADGPFIYTGFRPKFLLIKRTDVAQSWQITDSSRDPYNVATNALFPNTTAGDGTGYLFDLLSNGFKIREAGNNVNANGGNYIYAVFAETPFKYAGAR